MGNEYLSNEDFELVDTEIDTVATEASASRVSQYADMLDHTDFMHGPRVFAVSRLWSMYRAEWKSVRREYLKASMRSNIDEQKAALIKERELIMETIKAVDTIPENAIANIAFMTGLTALTIGLSGMVLSLPASVIIAEAGKDAFMASGGTAAAFTAHSVKAGMSGTIAVAATVSQAALALKMIGLTVKYSDPTHSVLRSQKATGVMSKQLLMLNLNRSLANLDKKLRYVMTKQLLVTNQYALEAMEKYSDRYLENFVTQTNNMNSKMNDAAVRFADEATFMANKNKGNGNNGSNKGDKKGKKKSKEDTIAESINKLIKEVS